MLTPLSPWTTSRMTAAVESPTARSSAAASLNGTWVVSSRGKPFAILWFPRHRRRTHRPAVKALGRGNEGGSLRHEPRELQRAVHRLRATVGEKHVGQVIGEHVDQGGGEARARTSLYVAGQRISLRACCNRLADTRMAVPQHRDALCR